ncbi:hypothetical protein [Crocosphaera sp.]|uniref:hypothetical protein n=1 Tax=Crocosphaera sp. TaxID=2729996 RepID=UPI0026198C76|nr:hypothetical protein [Crocosphaera sp.]MDJ0580921.1 hypothetical protein [Crocosphaera sp.]
MIDDVVVYIHNHLNIQEIIVTHLPAHIKYALITRSAEINYPVEAFIEMAIANFLDTE